MKTTPIIIALLASIAGNCYQYQRTQAQAPTSIVRIEQVDEPVIIRTKGGLLEVSAIRAKEQFESSNVHSILGASIGKTTTQIRVPAVYRYNIELAREWEIHLKDKAFFVIAPAVKAALPVAIDTSGIEKQSSGIWSALTATSSLDKLERSISPVLATRAMSRKYLELQREVSRVTVKEFVEKWLVTQEQWKAASSYPIHVYFSDEPIQALGKVAPQLAMSK